MPLDLSIACRQLVGINLIESTKLDYITESVYCPLDAKATRKDSETVDG